MFLRIQCEERTSVEQLSDVGYWFDRRMCERAVVASQGRRFVSNKEKINRLTSLSLSLFLSSLPSPLLPSNGFLREEPSSHAENFRQRFYLYIIMIAHSAQRYGTSFRTPAVIITFVSTNSSLISNFIVKFAFKVIPNY